MGAELLTAGHIRLGFGGIDPVLGSLKDRPGFQATVPFSVWDNYKDFGIWTEMALGCFEGLKIGGRWWGGECGN